MLIIASSFVSCSDVLDKTPLDIISDEAVWNDEALIEAYLVQCYYHMSYFGNESVGTGWQGDAYFSTNAFKAVLKPSASPACT